MFLTKNYADLNPDDYDDDAMKYEIYEIDQLAVGQFLGIGMGLTLSRMVRFGGSDCPFCDIDGRLSPCFFSSSSFERSSMDWESTEPCNTWSVLSLRVWWPFAASLSGH